MGRGLVATQWALNMLLLLNLRHLRRAGQARILSDFELVSACHLYGGCICPVRRRLHGHPRVPAAVHIVAWLTSVLLLDLVLEL